VFGDMVDTFSGMRTLKEDARAVARGVDHGVTRGVLRIGAQGRHKHSRAVPAVRGHPDDGVPVARAVPANGEGGLVSTMSPVLTPVWRSASPSSWPLLIHRIAHGRIVPPLRFTSTLTSSTRTMGLFGAKAIPRPGWARWVRLVIHVLSRHSGHRRVGTAREASASARSAPTTSPQSSPLHFCQSPLERR
jgi:hypothetical protein